jgi:hypothetical protein
MERMFGYVLTFAARRDRCLISLDVCIPAAIPPRCYSLSSRPSVSDVFSYFGILLKSYLSVVIPIK